MAASGTGYSKSGGSAKVAGFHKVTGDKLTYKPAFTGQETPKLATFGNQTGGWQTNPRQVAHNQALAASSAGFKTAAPGVGKKVLNWGKKTAAEPGTHVLTVKPVGGGKAYQPKATISTTQFQAAHGKAPKGKGNWVFKFGATSRNFNGTYTAAKKFAKGFAKYIDYTGTIQVGS